VDAPETEAKFFADGDAPPPAPEDDIYDVDPELLRLPRSRRGRHPVVSLLVIVVSLYLIWALRTDLIFFVQSRTPVDLGEVSKALAAGRMTPNRYVRLVGAPDRKHAVLLEGRLGGYETFFRLLRGDNRVFVQRHRSSRVSDREVNSVQVGQLVQFGSLPYRQSIREYLAKTTTIAHELDFATVKKAKAAAGPTGAAQVTDRDGNPVRLKGDTDLWINAAYPDEWLVQFAKKSFAAPKGPAEELKQLGLPFVRDKEPSTLFWRFVVVATPEQAHTLMAAYRPRRMTVGVIRRQVSYSAKWDQVRVQGQTLVIDARDPTFPLRYEAVDGKVVARKDRVARVPASAVLFITTSSPYVIDDNALVLLEGRSPGDVWYYALLALVLLGFMGLNVAVLWTWARGRWGSHARGA